MTAGQRSAPKGSVVWMTPSPFSQTARAMTSVVPANRVPISTTTFGRAARINENSVAREPSLMNDRGGQLRKNPSR